MPKHVDLIAQILRTRGDSSSRSSDAHWNDEYFMGDLSEKRRRREGLPYTPFRKASPRKRTRRSDSSSRSSDSYWGASEFMGDLSEKRKRRQGMPYTPRRKQSRRR